MDIYEEESETTPDEVEEDSTSDTPQNELAIQTLHNAETIELPQTEKLKQFIVPDDEGMWYRKTHVIASDDSKYWLENLRC